MQFLKQKNKELKFMKKHGFISQKTRITTNKSKVIFLNFFYVFLDSNSSLLTRNKLRSASKY